MLYLVGQVRSFSQNQWEFQGIFDDLELAKKACKNQYYFIAPIGLNQEVPDEELAWESTMHGRELDYGITWFPLWNEDTVNER